MKKLIYGKGEMGGPRHLYREGLILRFLREILSSGKVIDAGCGDGSLSIKLARRGFFVYAIDLSEEFTEHLKVKAERLNLRELICVQKGSILDLVLPEENFDIIACGEVLEHIEKDVEVIKKFYRLLKKGGICIVTVPLKSKGWDIWDELSGHQRLYTKKELVEKFESCSFKVEKTLIWGFPIMKLYHRIIFLKWAKKVEEKDQLEWKNLVSTRIGLNKIFSICISWLFRFDETFGNSSLGIGMILRARKA